jgi:phage terminase large subunit-like protein
MATRWHEADLTAWMIDTYACPYLNIQGICTHEDDGTGRKVGEPLFPQVHPIEMLLMQRQASPIEFEAQYQGQPRPAGDALFDEPGRFSKLPDISFQCGYGVDLAYSESTASDWSVCLKGRRYGDTIYVLDMARKQVIANKFLVDIKRMVQKERAPLRWYYGGGGELGVLNFIQNEIQGFSGIPAKDDKLVRSTPAQKQWNLKHILLPSEESIYYGPWVELVRKEVMLFTGMNDPHDDIVDSLAALNDQLFGGSINWSDVDKWKKMQPHFGI